MTGSRQSICPGCKVSLPVGAPCDTRSYTTSPECMDLFTEVLAVEYGDAFLFGQVHQLTVDAYAVQHAGGIHRDKSVVIHLTGLYLVLEEGHPPPGVPKLLQRMAKSMAGEYPRFAPPDDLGELTILDVALAVGDAATYVETVKRWAGSVWRGWSSRHEDVAELARRHVHLR